MTWSKLCEAIVDIVRELVDLAKARRDASVREHAANDGSGLLLKQLNPGSADIDQPATGEPGRGTGTVDER